MKYILLALLFLGCQKEEQDFWKDKPLGYTVSGEELKQLIPTNKNLRYVKGNPEPVYQWRQRGSRPIDNVPPPFALGFNCQDRDSIIEANLNLISNPHEKIRFLGMVVHEQSIMTSAPGVDVNEVYGHNSQEMSSIDWCEGFNVPLFAASCNGYSRHLWTLLVKYGLDSLRQGTSTISDSFDSHTWAKVGLANSYAYLDCMYGYDYTDQYGNFIDPSETTKDLYMNGGDRVFINEWDVTSSYVQADIGAPCIPCDYDHTQVESITLIDSSVPLFLVRAKRDASWFVKNWGFFYTVLIQEITGEYRPIRTVQGIKWLAWAKPEFQGDISGQNYTDSLTSLEPFDLEYNYENRSN